MSTNTVDIDHLDALEAKATKGPWKRHKLSVNVVDITGGTIVVNHDCHPDDSMDRDVLDAMRADADLIPALRNAYPAIARELRELRAEVQKARTA